MSGFGRGHEEVRLRDDFFRQVVFGMATPSHMLRDHGYDISFRFFHQKDSSKKVSNKKMRISPRLAMPMPTAISQSLGSTRTMGLCLLCAHNTLTKIIYWWPGWLVASALYTVCCLCFCLTMQPKPKWRACA
jgi:hypothetical protein